MAVRARARAAVLALAAITSALAASCGGDRGGGAATTSAATGDDAGDQVSPVAVVGSRVAIDPQHITLSLRLKQPQDVDPPVARTATVTLRGKGIDYDGARQPACDAATIRRQGVDACPKDAIVGTGEAVGTADVAQTKAQITIVNGGPGRVLLATLIRNPAYVRTIVPGRISKSDGKLTMAFTFPPDLQDIGGVPIGLQQLTLALNRGGAVTATRCDDWQYAASVAFVDHTTARHQGRVTCQAS